MSALISFFILLLIMVLFAVCSIYQAVKEVLRAIFGTQEKNYGNRS